MIYAYTRVSTDKQSLENQRFALQEYARRAGFTIGEWVSETVSGVKACGARKLGGLFKRVRRGDTVVVSEISRLGRNIYMVMEVLGFCISKGCRVVSVKEGRGLGDDVGSAVLAFAFSLVAQIERDLVSQRTKEALARRKAEGKPLGRRRGFAPAKRRLEARRAEICEALERGETRGKIAKMCGVGVTTLRGYLRCDGFVLSWISRGGAEMRRLDKKTKNDRVNHLSCNEGTELKM